MAKHGGATTVFMAVTICSLVLLASAENKLSEDALVSSSSSKNSKTYTHTWPAIKEGWRIVVGSIMAFIGAAFGSVGGVGGGVIFVPMLTLVIGFDAKSSAAISKCMIVGAATSTVSYNIRQRHPTLDMPMIDYDLALLFQPMLLLGISIGVALNVILASWMVTVVLIVLCLITSTMSFFKGMRKWKKETVQKEADLKSSLTGLNMRTSTNNAENDILTGRSDKCVKVSITKNIHWRKVGIILCVWSTVLALQISKSYTSKCSTMYWLLDLLQIPVVIIASGYEAVMLYKGKRIIASRGENGTNLGAWQLLFYCVMGVVAGTLGGLVGLGGGVIMGPLFLQLGIPPQVSSATATFIMLFSSSISVVEYYLLKRFPIPYTLYFVGVTTLAAVVGQYVVKRVIAVIGRVSLIIFVLTFTVFFGALLMGGQGMISMVNTIQHHEYMGIESMCSQHS